MLACLLDRIVHAVTIALLTGEEGSECTGEERREETARGFSDETMREWAERGADQRVKCWRAEEQSHTKSIGQ